MTTPSEKRSIDVRPAGTVTGGGEERDPHFRRNFSLGVINGILFNNGLSFFNRTTIIPVFVSMLGGPSILISITALFEVLGWHLPQLLASKYVVHKPQKMSLYGLAALIRVAGLVLAVVSPLTVGPLGTLAALVLFTLGYGTFAMAGGFAGLVFTEIVAKTVPKEKRGSYFGMRAIFSGLAGLYLGVGVITPIISSNPFPTNYFLVFLVGTVLIALSFFLFVQQKEPVQTNLPEQRSHRSQLARARDILREDERFRKFIVFRALMMLWFAGLPFYMLFAKDRLGAREEEIGIYISWEFAGMIGANLLWGYLSNRIGNRILLIVVCMLGVVVSAGALLFDADLLPRWAFGSIFFLSAAVDSGAGTGGINYSLEIVPEGERPTYVGLMNSILAIALIGAAIVGSMRDLVGYGGLFAITGVIALASLVLIVRLPEPRVGG